MSYIAVIVESPAKCSKIESFLGSGYKCMASFGHIRTMDHIDCISDRNPKKNGFYTPNTKIKIVSELYSRKINPDYYLVLPWHFKKEILQREKKQRRYSKFIFPLPNLEIY